MQALRHFFIALQFFTRIPVTGALAAWVGFSPAMLRAAAGHFPGVGWVVGAAGAAAFALALAALGGFEIATLTGALLQAASERRVIVVDGFITTAAALAACELAPNARPYCVFAHHSQERGHTLMLERLHAQALLDLGLRLGEGTGAMLAWPLLQSACAILNEMATFESAQVSNRA